MMGFAAVALVLGCAYGLPSEDLDKPHKWVPAEQCTFVNPPRVPYYWDEKCAVESLGCWADGVHNQCRFCGEAPYTGLKCPEDAIVPNRRACAFDNPPIVPFYWEPTCEDGMLGCFADGHNLGCRYCGHGIYENVSCPTSVCSFVNEPVTPYYWDTLCQMGMLGCNADGIHVQCRFCDFQPFNAIQCPESARPTYEDGECWFPMGTAQTHKWNPRCQWGILGCWADGVHRQCQYCGPGSDGIYEGINCTDDDDDDRRLHGHEGEAQKGSSVVFP